MKATKAKGILGLVLVILLSVATLLGACQAAPAAQSPAPTAAPTATPTPKPAAKPATVDLKVALYHAGTTDIGVTYHKWEPKFEELSGGRVKVKVYDSETLAKGSAFLDGIQRGMFDFAESWAPYWGSSVPLVDVVNVPVWRDTKGDFDAHRNGLLALFEENYQKAGYDNVRVIAFHPSGVKILHNTKPFKVPSDLKGTKQRSNSPIDTELYQAAGAGVVNVAFNEVYESLQRGIMNGGAGSLMAFYDNKWFEVAKYALDMPMGVTPQTVLASKKTLAGLTPEDRGIVLALFDAITLDLSAQRALMDSYLQNFVLPKAGVTFYRPTAAEQAEWIKIREKSKATWLAKTGDMGKRALDIIDKYNQ